MPMPIRPPGETRECRCLTVVHQHGTVLAYNSDRCRCGDCRAASREHRAADYRRAAYERWAGTDHWVAPVVVTRRLQALAAIGWSAETIALRMGRAGSNVARLRVATWRIHPSTAARVRVVFDELALAIPTPGRAVTRTKELASRRGWVPPLAWDDDTIDDPTARPATTGHESPVEISEIDVDLLMAGLIPVSIRYGRHGARPELVEAIRRLAAAGRTDRDIAERLGMRADAVCHQRIRHNIPAGQPKVAA